MEQDELKLNEENKLPIGIKEVDLNHEMKESFLSYAMSVYIYKYKTGA